jgi:hypothetical protein
MAKTYEAVIYSLGCSLYHEKDDGAILRPNVVEWKRIEFTDDMVFGKKKPRGGKYYYIYKKHPKKILNNMLFVSLADMKNYMQTIPEYRLGFNCYYTELHDDKFWDGHR